MEVTQLGLSLSEKLTRRESQNQVQSADPAEASGRTSSFSPADRLDTYRFSSLPNPVDMEEMLEYFQLNTSKSVRQDVDKLKNELTSREDMDRFMMAKLFSLDEEEQAEELRRLLQELDQADELEKILFGEEVPSSEPSHSDLSLNLNFELKVLKERKEAGERKEQREELEMSLEAAMEADPLVLDLDGDGIETTGLEQGVNFDIDGDGQLEQTSFVSGDDFLLALDRNSNGVLDSGKELFGDANGFADGIAELSAYDENQDGFIDKHDSVYQDLMLVNKNRPSRSLADAGVEGISLQRLNQTGFTNMGDRYDGGLEFSLSNGQKRRALDIYFQMRNKN